MHSAPLLALQAAAPDAVTCLMLRVQLKAVRLLKAADVILYDDLGAEASPRHMPLTVVCCKHYITPDSWESTSLQQPALDWRQKWESDWRREQ